MVASQDNIRTHEQSMDEGDSGSPLLESRMSISDLTEPRPSPPPILRRHAPHSQECRTEEDPWTTDSTDDDDLEDDDDDDDEELLNQRLARAPRHSHSSHRVSSTVSKSMQPHSPHSKLTTPTNRPFVHIEEEMYRDCTFRPRITPVARRQRSSMIRSITNSSQADTTDEDGRSRSTQALNFEDRLYRRDLQRRTERIEQKRYEAAIQRSRSEMQEYAAHCTFHPVTNAPVDSRYSEVVSDDPGVTSVFRRLYATDKRAQHQREYQQQQALVLSPSKVQSRERQTIISFTTASSARILTSQDVKECSFRPQITNYGQKSKGKYHDTKDFVLKKRQSIKLTAASRSPYRAPTPKHINLQLFQRLHTDAARRRETRDNMVEALPVARGVSPYRTVLKSSAQEVLFERLAQPKQYSAPDGEEPVEHIQRSRGTRRTEFSRSPTRPQTSPARNHPVANHTATHTANSASRDSAPLLTSVEEYMERYGNKKSNARSVPSA